MLISHFLSLVHHEEMSCSMTCFGNLFSYLEYFYTFSLSAQKATCIYSYRGWVQKKLGNNDVSSVLRVLGLDSEAY